MKTILVTGGAGYIGSIAVRRLLEEKYNVIVLDNLSRGHKESLPQEVKLVKISISDEQKVLDFLGKNKIDAVIHFAAYAYVGESVTDPNLYYNNNLVKGLIFLECLKKKNIKNIIFSSSCATYGLPKEIPIQEDAIQFPINPYGFTKYLFEQALKFYEATSGIKFVALRYFNAAGAAYGIGEDHRPETHIIPNALQVALGKKDHFDLFGTDYETSDGTCIRDYVHVLDLIEAHILALKHLENGGESKFYNLAIGKGYSNKEILKTCEEVTGKKILVIERERRMGDPPILYASAEKIKEELGWEPKYELKDMVQSAWDWHKKNSEGYH
ncbi:MAG TPA: UDP-glucose 4-epimerase GalE [Nanoarchaeota archaeon]|nr:UDP-glucose 4-epimerase GalE [Candidatus Woesearchaeota archaeon]HIH15629.1 UDP-glucose 4-epimerase GalE [Nanoarchaeota archaeon]HIH59523.1 UDP-glucose 4-epimerase GalE [Nanoarchaeota archaeon]